MPESRHCSQCGAPLPADSLSGHCPKCLLDFAPTVQAGDVTQAPIAGSVKAVVNPINDLPPVSPSSVTTMPGPTIRYLGDYELLEEIARGGMGVVWKGRQISLNRPVAVKMILAGKFATETDVKRFRTEAESAANLQHPNIVAIHEVGEHEGQHYFSMDFIEGKSLAELTVDGPIPAARAADLVKRIAEAIHYAHQRGTLHRDLKPSNVLIDASGNPRITDFGLAKQLDRASGLTHSGAVMGTPAYMPPEQASGRSDLIGPASDVYSLGAILYYLLVGRAPFLTESAVLTLRKVIEEEPLAPSKLNPKILPDIETICLKCLEKKTERRYPSAGALAEELDRFLKHEPILARPASKVRKSWIWLQHHPWIVTGLASGLVVALLGFAYGLWEQNRFLVWQKSHPSATGVQGPRARWLIRGTFLGVIVSFVQILAGSRFLVLAQRRRQTGLAVPRPFLACYGFLGLVGILYGVRFTFGIITAYVWEGVILVAHPLKEGLQSDYSLTSFTGLDDFVVSAFFALAAASMLVAPAWWGASMIWSVIREYESWIFEKESAAKLNILGFADDEWRWNPSRGGLFLIAITLLVLAGYLCSLPPADQRAGACLAGAIAALAAFSVPFLSIRKPRYKRSVAWGGTVLVVVCILSALGFLPSSMVSTAVMLFASAHCGLLLAMAIRKKRGESLPSKAS